MQVSSQFIYVSYIVECSELQCEGLRDFREMFYNKIRNFPEDEFIFNKF